MASFSYDGTSIINPNNIDYSNPENSLLIPKKDIHDEFVRFLSNYRSDNNSSEFPYRLQLKQNCLNGQYYLEVDLNHIITESPILSQLITQHPGEYLSVFESAAGFVAEAVLNEAPNDPNSNSININNRKPPHNIQIQLKNYSKHTEIRDLASRHVGKLVSIRGIVVSAGRPRIKATKLTIICRNCKLVKTLYCGSGFGGAQLPRTCDSNSQAGLQGQMKCPLDPYQILADSSEYIDQQRLKLQESPESVPTGELPRHLSLASERYLVGKVKPGTRVNIVGMYTTYEANSRNDSNNNLTADAVGIRIPYLRVFGIEQQNESNEFLLGRFDHSDEESMLELSKLPNLYERIASSMCPAIFDNEDIRNVKRALAVQLFGGARKQLPDGMRLRGDVNILLLGDPSVAKSQFLKFASQVAPIGVYTSGKGSSAAGLTASVIRDPGSGEFSLEGGALVLADGGLVCIDEFDKMRDQDRVAIHEAMEQQTISIAKAGITTILNSRTSVLAAANPIFGRYDDMRSPTENIDFQTTILSRFDMIFILRDVQDSQRDMNLARHVLAVHRYKDAAVQQITQNQQAGGLLDIKQLRKYVAYARSKVNPRLSEEAAETLKNQYVKFRSSVANKSSGIANSTSIPITVRQLEAIIRISEALARMELSPIATIKHVEESLRLFQVSTYRAATTNQSTDSSIINSTNMDRRIKTAENEILLRLPIGNSMRVVQLVQECGYKQIDEIAVKQALAFMAERKQIEMTAQGKYIRRIQ